MPGMSDTRFARSVIFLCAHSEEGAMGIVINRELESLTFDDLMEQLDIETGGEDVDLPVQSGGPVETGRGFVLHSPDRSEEHTSELQSLMRISYAVFCLKKKQNIERTYHVQ